MTPDQDPRASYAVVEDAEVTLGRAAYDIERTVRDLRGLGLDGDTTERLIVMLRTGAD